MRRCVTKLMDDIPLVLLIEVFTLVRVASILLLVTFSVLYNLF